MRVHVTITLDEFIEGSEEIMGFYRLLAKTAAEVNTKDSREVADAIMSVIDHIQNTVGNLKKGDEEAARQSMMQAIRMEHQFMEKAWKYVHMEDMFEEAMKHPQ